MQCVYSCPWYAAFYFKLVTFHSYPLNMIWLLRVHMNALCLPLFMGLLHGNISFPFQAIQKLCARKAKIYVLGCFVNFWAIFGYSLEEIVFLKKIMSLVDGRENSLLRAWDALVWVSTVRWCSKNNFLSSIPSLNLKNSIKFRCTPALEISF